MSRGKDPRPQTGEGMISFDSEKAFETFLLASPELMEEEFGVTESFRVFPQMELGPYGIPDIVAVEVLEPPDEKKIVTVKIFELKNAPLTLANVAQISRYKDFFNDAARGMNVDYDVDAYLIGAKTFPTQNGSDLVYLCQNIDWLSVYEFALNPRKGIEFHAVREWRPSSLCEGHYIDFWAAAYPSLIEQVTDDEGAE